MPNPASTETADDHLLESLASLEGAVNYRNWLLRLAQPFVVAPVLEIGAGRGTFTTFLAATGAVTAIEPSERMAELLASAVSAQPQVSVVVGELKDVPEEARHGSAVMFNVLEHIEDDGEALRQIHARLQPGAHLVLWVPAFQILMSRFDRRIGHYRRYRLRGLRKLVQQSGFSVVDSRYANAPGWFTWLIFCRLLRGNPIGGALPRMFDRILVPVISRVERLIRPPFGQSVFLVARK
ncbi:MAG: class I SAM-dependent methyltransferase [Actinomycetia bacterium]|nr:class I SAM-dependent methyltransferase [Actinomycetes bacterium]